MNITKHPNGYTLDVSPGEVAVIVAALESQTDDLALCLKDASDPVLMKLWRGELAATRRVRDAMAGGAL